MYVFTFHFWHTKGWTPRNQCSKKRVLSSETPGSWRVTVKMEPEEVRQGQWVGLADVQVVRPRGGMSTCRAMAAGGVAAVGSQVEVI